MPSADRPPSITRVDGGSWTIYTGKFSTGTSGVSHTVDYYAVDSAGNTESAKQTSSYEAKSTSGSSVAPSAPTTLRATSVYGGLKLSWKAPTTTGTATLLGYKIYRGLGTATPVLIGTSTTTSFTDTSVVANQQYRYYVTAYSSAGESSRLGPMIVKLQVVLTANAATSNALTMAPDQNDMNGVLVGRGRQRCGQQRRHLHDHGLDHGTAPGGHRPSGGLALQEAWTRLSPNHLNPSPPSPF